MRLIILSGRSGSGKTIALHVLEDLGFYCIDNLPLAMLVDLPTHLASTHERVAVSIDARNIPTDLEHFTEIFSLLNQQIGKSEIIYLDADENTLLKRFSETRRKHPLTNKKISLREAIRQEYNLLTPIANLADLTIDTTPLSIQALHHLIRERVAHYQDSCLQVQLQSFGFKYGLPPDADFVFDVRCLKNPYWEPRLRPLNGLDLNIAEYLEKQADVQLMLKEIEQFLKNWLPRFEADNRSYITVAIGCTGGKHRSVYLVESLAKKLSNVIPHLQIRHRELKL
ncbi:MAG: hypothetical protein RLZ35_616 [Pseudomonadota bacterium]|jgi:UPF0042 nucleotide-binding protein